MGFGSVGVGWVHHVTRSARAAKLWGLVKPWAVRRRTWRRLLVPSMRPLLGRRRCARRGCGHVSDERVDDLVELGQVAGLVEIGEPVQGGEGAGLVVGEVQAVQLAERLPGVAQPRVRLEDGFELGALGVVEAVGAAQQQEPGPEHFGVEDRCGAGGLAALDVAAHRGPGPRRTSR